MILRSSKTELANKISDMIEEIKSINRLMFGDHFEDLTFQVLQWRNERICHIMAYAGITN